MKKLFITVAVLAITVTTALVACKKGNDTPSTEVTPTNLERAIIFSLKVNEEYGFLEFDKVEDLDKYKEQIVGNTHGEVKEYLNSKGFNSLGKILFEDIPNEQEVTEEQATMYLLNQKGVVLVKGVIMKQLEHTRPIEDWNYFLSMNINKLNAENYADISNGIFRSEIMNKFTCGEELDNWLFEFIGEHPFGHVSTTPSTTEAKRKPMFGSTTTGNNGTCNDMGNPDLVGKTCCFAIKKTYFFWIKVNTEEDGQRVGSCESLGIPLDR